MIPEPTHEEPQYKTKYILSGHTDGAEWPVEVWEQTSTPITNKIAEYLTDPVGEWNAQEVALSAAVDLMSRGVWKFESPADPTGGTVAYGICVVQFVCM